MSKNRGFRNVFELEQAMQVEEIEIEGCRCNSLNAGRDSHQASAIKWPHRTTPIQGDGIRAAWQLRPIDRQDLPM
jgi:hypothetical protein